MFLLNSRIPLVRFSSESVVNCASRKDFPSLHAGFNLAVNTSYGHHNALFRLNSRNPLVRTSSELIV